MAESVWPSGPSVRIVTLLARFPSVQEVYRVVIHETIWCCLAEAVSALDLTDIVQLPLLSLLPYLRNPHTSRSAAQRGAAQNVRHPRSTQIFSMHQTY